MKTKIYDESGTELENPDLTLGWVEQKQRVIAEHPATKEVSHIELIPYTNGLRRKVIDTPAKEPWKEYEVYGVYHPYTPEELAARTAPTTEERLVATEAAIMELAGMIAGGA